MAAGPQRKIFRTIYRPCGNVAATSTWAFRLATGALKTCRTNVIGSGLRLKSQIDYEALGMDEEAARDLERKIEREFSLWADSTACDPERLDSFYELQQLAFLNWLMSGDVIATLPVTKRANILRPANLSDRSGQVEQSERDC